MDALAMEDPQAETDAPDPKTAALVQTIAKRIKADKEHHKKAFADMRRDMFVVRHGYEKDKYPETSYRANLAGRHVKTKTAALYAKNPKAVAKRRETLDFVEWDENPQTLLMAFNTLEQAKEMLAPQPSSIVDPATGQPMQAAAPQISPEMEQAFMKAQGVVADYQQGMQRRQDIQKIGKTLEILFAQALREQKPVDFKTGMKKAVRRACTTSVMYLELGFQRETGPRPGMTEKLSDARVRLDHLQRLAAEMAEGEIDEDAAERAELEASVAALQAEPEIVLREGLIIDFPASTRVIPDKLCTSLVGFIGARHVTLEYFFTPDEVQELFKVDLGRKFKGYGANGQLDKDKSSATQVVDEDEEPVSVEEGEGLVCVWKHYDKPSGLVYYLADGHPAWLRDPAAPDVFVEDFWPLYALTFNEVESEDSPFPPSDVALMLPMQNEYNRSRQGMREHRRAARPRYLSAKGAFESDDLKRIAETEPFEVTEVNPPPQGTKIAEQLEVFPVPGVDPNLYETGQLFTDIQLVVGTSEAQFGGTAKATATESAIAANSSASSDGSSIDDLDAFLTTVARAAGQILLREMSEEQVKLVAGPGAVWPQMSLADIASEVFLEVEAGSTGKPNQAVEMNNWQTMLPFLIQMPGIQPEWLARESLRRLDDRMDLTEALAAGIPSIMMMNQMQQPGTGDAATDPNAQGGQGGNNAPAAPGGEGGSGPAFGSNQV